MTRRSLCFLGAAAFAVAAPPPEGAPRKSQTVTRMAPTPKGVMLPRQLNIEGWLFYPWPCVSLLVCGKSSYTPLTRGCGASPRRTGTSAVTEGSPNFGREQKRDPPSERRWELTRGTPNEGCGGTRRETGSGKAALIAECSESVLAARLFLLEVGSSGGKWDAANTAAAGVLFIRGDPRMHLKPRSGPSSDSNAHPSLLHPAC
ncbi:hypothetical protein P4O66_008400 [Electrophorus voltai]|uniref:Secreted protein n=1 Tax=Electrophorus voltai TaxID=2609070 RepID=A0AAD9DXV1_9TELE|nr:hypothetical protein P4O66_008400 [Electrophorus voltai]